MSVQQELRVMQWSENGQPSLMDIVLRFFQDSQWNYQPVEGRPVIRAGYRGEHGTWVCYARVDEDNRRFVFQSSMGLNIAPEQRAAVVEYLARVNSLLELGSFVMDMDSGAVHFRTAVETPTGELTVALVGALVNANVRSMDHYFPGVLAVVHGGLSPQAALARLDALAVEV